MTITDILMTITDILRAAECRSTTAWRVGRQTCHWIRGSGPTASRRHMSKHMSIHMSIHMSMHMSIYKCPYTCLCTCLYAYLYTCLYTVPKHTGWDLEVMRDCRTRGARCTPLPSCVPMQGNLPDNYRVYPCEEIYLTTGFTSKPSLAIPRRSSEDS